MTTSRPARAWAEITGGDALGRGQQPALSWWLPEGSSVQHAYQVRAGDGFDTGRVASAVQSFVRVPVFDRSRRFAGAQVRVWTDRGESEWSDPVALESGLLGEDDWAARWIGVAGESRGAPGARGAWWVRTSFEVAPFGRSRFYVSALGLYEAFIDGQRVGDAELTPGYTQYRARVQYQAFDVGPLLRPGPHVLAVLLADGWYRGQVGLPRAAAATGPGWRTAPSHVTAADLIGGQREDRRRLDPAVHDPAFDDAGWRPAVPREAGVAVVRSIAPPVRRVASFLHRYVAGLRPVGAGYRTFEVRPLPGDGITSARARHISPFGPIEVEWRVRGEAFELDVLVPPGTTASVVRPGQAPCDVHPGRHHWTGPRLPPARP